MQRKVYVHKLVLPAATDDSLKVKSISPLGRDSNNYVHLVYLEDAVERYSHGQLPRQPGTQALDLSVTKIVMRLSNPAAMLDEEVRVENEVAAMVLMRHALATTLRRIVPKVYAWEPAKEGCGWIAQEYLEGEQLSVRMTKLPADKATFVVDQIAELFAMIQRFDPQVKGFGGLKFDEDGGVVPGRSSLWSIGPFDKYSDMYRGILMKQMTTATTTPLLDGWKGTGLQEGLKNLSESAVWKALLSQFDGFKPTLVHGDLCQYPEVRLFPELTSAQRLRISWWIPKRCKSLDCWILTSLTLLHQRTSFSTRSWTLVALCLDHSRMKLCSA